MKRDLQQQLLKWYAAQDRKPLVLQGARQVGKTYLLQKFGEEHFEDCAYINFERESAACDLFTESLNPTILLPKLELYLGKSINPNKTLLIFDEIQVCPSALNSLKYFCEDARQYAVIAAGSLLGIKLARSKGFPVGKVDFLQLFPLTFFEFLTALDQTGLRELIDNAPVFQPIAEPFHTRLQEYLRLYFYVGGMPEAVKNYIDTKDFLQVRKIQENILMSYQLDFAKYADNAVDVARISAVWSSIPKQLAKENKKFIFSALRKSARGREYESAIQWLLDASLIYKSHLISKPELPLRTYADESIFKIYMNDVGLLSAMNDVLAKHLLEKEQVFTEYKDSLTENFVAQELCAWEQDLFYWSSEGKAELDFIAAHEGNIYPLEVKAGTNANRKKSLRVYFDIYHPPICARATLMNYRVDGNIANIPLYLICKFPAVLAKIGGEKPAA